MNPDSFWHHKPWWCQPWSIVCTGVGSVIGTLIWPSRWWITLPLILAVLIWWLLFLVLVPAAWLQNHETPD